MIDSLVQQIAQSAATTAPMDLPALVSLTELFEELSAQLDQPGLMPLNERAQNSVELLERIVMHEADDLDVIFEEINRTIEYAREIAAAIGEGVSPDEIPVPPIADAFTIAQIDAYSQPPAGVQQQRPTDDLKAHDFGQSDQPGPDVIPEPADAAPDTAPNTDAPGALPEPADDTSRIATPSMTEQSQSPDECESEFGKNIAAKEEAAQSETKPGRARRKRDQR